MQLPLSLTVIFWSILCQRIQDEDLSPSEIQEYFISLCSALHFGSHTVNLNNYLFKSINDD